MKITIIQLWSATSENYADFPAWVRASYSAIMLGGLCGFLKYTGREVPEK